MEINTTIIKTLKTNIDPQSIGKDVFDGFDVESEIFLPMVEALNSDLQYDTNYEFYVSDLPQDIKKMIYDIALREFIDRLKDFYEEYDDFSGLEEKVSYQAHFFLSLPIRGRLGDGSPEPKIIPQILAKSQDQNALFCVKIFSSRNVTFFMLTLIFKIFLCFCLFSIALYHRNGIIKTVKGGGFKKTY